MSISSLAYETGNYAPDLIIGKVIGFFPPDYIAEQLGSYQLSNIL